MNKLIKALHILGSIDCTNKFIRIDMVEIIEKELAFAKESHINLRKENQRLRVELDECKGVVR